jgi:hypothetical protein
MARSFIRYPLTAEAEFDPRIPHEGIVVEKVAPNLLSPRPGHFGLHPPAVLFYQRSTPIIH